VIKQSAAKYSKSTYSPVFWVQYACGDQHARRGVGFNSTLALSDDDQFWYCRRKTLDAQSENGNLRFKWRSWPDVKTKTWLFLLLSYPSQGGDFRVV
jgi:hypothetical protein